MNPEYMKMAEDLLPCTGIHVGWKDCLDGIHSGVCPAICRAAVAAKLQEVAEERGRENSELRLIVSCKTTTITNLVNGMIESYHGNAKEK